MLKHFLLILNRNSCQWFNVAVKLKAKEFCDDPDFKASLGWYQKWKRRHSISLRTKTTLAQRLPNDLEEQTLKFHRFVIGARQRCGYSLARIFNMDETPMRFELPSSRTLEFSGSRTVPVESCGAEKRSFTVTLAVAADGKKIPPAVIFKGVRTPRDPVVPDSVRVSFHKKGWMDKAGKLVVLFCFMKCLLRDILASTDFYLLSISGVKEWIRTCLPRSPVDERSLLVWDSLRAHLTDSVKEVLPRRKVDVAIIPGCLTPVLQPLDKCLNKPFKDNIRRQYLSWLITGPFELHLPGRRRLRHETRSFDG